MVRALVTGATGFVGTALCRELVANGYQVRAVHRVTSKRELLEGLDVEWFEGDVRDAERMKSACEGQDLVFHIAALFREAKHPDEVYEAINIEGTRNVLEAAASAGVQYTVHCSTVGVHSHIPNPPAAEDEEYRPADIYQRTKCVGEKVALEHFRNESPRGAVIRPAMIWGPGDQRTLKLFRGISRKRLPVIGSGKTMLHWVMVDDLARAFRLVGEQQPESGSVYIVAGERAVTMNELYTAIASETGSEVLPFRVPALPLQLAGSICEALCVPFGWEPPLYRRRVDFFTKTRSFDITKVSKEVGYRPSRSFEGEVHVIAEWYRSKGWL